MLYICNNARGAASVSEPVSWLEALKKSPVVAATSLLEHQHDIDTFKENCGVVTTKCAHLLTSSDPTTMRCHHHTKCYHPEDLKEHRKILATTASYAIHMQSSQWFGTHEDAQLVD